MLMIQTNYIGSDEMRGYTIITSSDGNVKWTKQRFRPTLRQYRIQESLAKEFKKNGDRAIRLNWYLFALIVALNICLIWR